MCWTPCRSVWCGECYTPHPLDRFHHYVPTDEDGFEWRPADRCRSHLEARNGDHLLTPFQCDLCVFRNLKLRNPLHINPRDDLLLCCIRQINLDSVWGRESGTVSATLRAASQMITLWKTVDIPPTLAARGPFPVADSFGYSVAIAMVLKSLEPGRYSASHQQFETIRKLRAGYANVYMSSLGGSYSLRTVGGDKAKYTLSDSPTQSLWFERFSQGCLGRMGQEVRQDWAIPLPVMHALLDTLDAEWKELNKPEDKNFVASLGAYSAIAFCGSFRGPEVFLVDLYGLRKYLYRPPQEVSDFVIIPLLGKFKGETGERYHLTPLASTTSSGIRVREWVERLVLARAHEGWQHGPAFCDFAGSNGSFQGV